jgi:hypothetical protein
MTPDGRGNSTWLTQGLDEKRPVRRLNLKCTCRDIKKAGTSLTPALAERRSDWLAREGSNLEMAKLEGSCALNWFGNGRLSPVRQIRPNPFQGKLISNSKRLNFENRTA